MNYAQKGSKSIRTKKRPYVVAKSAQTLDGKIATTSGESKWITSAGSRRFARGVRDAFDAILVGSQTVIKDNPRLTGVKKSNTLKKIVLDSSLKISLDSKIFKGTSSENCIIITTKKAAASRVKAFQEKGALVLIITGKNGKIGLRAAFKKLAGYGIRSILIEGGSQVIGNAFKNGLVDELHTYIAPKICGDKNALSSFVGRKVLTIDQMVDVKIESIKTIGKDILVISHVLGNR